MQSELYDDLKTQLAHRHVVVVVGAGIALDATHANKLASWAGLLHNGVDRCVSVAQPLPVGWQDRVHAEVDTGDLDDLLSAAEKVSSKLGSPSGGEYRRWLRETVGSLRATRNDTIQALSRLGAVLATTNYDGLIEEVTGLPPVSWMDVARVERLLRGDEAGVLHLHGYWDRPESVILGVRSYEKVLGHDHA